MKSEVLIQQLTCKARLDIFILTMLSRKLIFKSEDTELRLIPRLGKVNVLLSIIYLLWATSVMHRATLSEATHITLAIFQFPQHLYPHTRSYVAVQIVLKIISCPTSDSAWHHVLPFIIVLIIIMGLLLGLCAICYTKIGKTSLSCVKGWVGLEV